MTVEIERRKFVAERLSAESLRRHYHDLMKTVDELAAEIGVNRQTVMAYMRRGGVDRRRCGRRPYGPSAGPGSGAR